MADTMIDDIEMDMHEIVVLVRGDMKNVKSFRTGLSMACITEAHSAGVEVLGVFNTTIMEEEENG